jgi:nicotinate phosphoribosyltransferase
LTRLREDHGSSGDLDEYRIREVAQRPARRSTSFGVGTQLAVHPPTLPTLGGGLQDGGAGDPGGIKRYTAKYSDDKSLRFPGAKQIFRDVARDVVARSGECGRGEALLRPVILGGRLIEPLPSLEEARTRARESVARLAPALRQLETTDPWPLIYSRELRALEEQTRLNLLGTAPVA